jgi:hypothetical protein
VLHWSFLTSGWLFAGISTARSHFAGTWHVLQLCSLFCNCAQSSESGLPTKQGNIGNVSLNSACCDVLIRISCDQLVQLRSYSIFAFYAESFTLNTHVKFRNRSRQAATASDSSIWLPYNSKGVRAI